MGREKRDFGTIRGEPLDEDDLLNMAEVDGEDVESAAEWWDIHASPDWVGALDNEPVNE
jgi:hypothetical protein